LVVELREVTDPSQVGPTNDVEKTGPPRPGFRLLETIRGDAEKVPLPHRPKSMYPEGYGFWWRKDRFAPSLKPGDRVLAFFGADFQSCRTVLATPSAELAVRTAAASPMRQEDTGFWPRQ
jgi:hypothetical protein